MTNDIDAQFLCKDCERYNLCLYYHGRKETSYICKFFHTKHKSGHWVDGLIAKVLEEVDGGTDDNYIRYTDICDRVTKSIRDYCEANMESEE